MKKNLFALLAFFCCVVPVFSQSDTEIYLKKADQFQSEGKFDEAVTEMSKVIALQPNNADFYLRRANLHLFKQNKPEVLADVQKAVSLNPTDKKILYYGTLTVFKSGQYEQSLLLVNALIALGEPDLSAFDLRVSIRTHLEDFAGAYEEITKLIELYPNDDRLKHNQANLIRLMGDSDKALEGFSSQIVSLETKLSKSENKEETQHLKHNLSFTFFSRAKIYQNKNEIEKMKADLIKAVDYHPIPVNYERRSQMYVKQRLYDEAMADLNKAIELDSDFAVFYMRRADLNYLLQKYSEAIKDYEQVLKLKSGLGSLAERRISSAKQKIQESGKQQK